MEGAPFLFFGSPPLGPIALDELARNGSVPTAIVDNPRLSTDEIIETIRKHKPAYILVASYGAILRQPVLDEVDGKILNIHPSLLPKYRGPAPVVQTALDGVNVTGVSVMQIDAKMDHGPLLAQETVTFSGSEPIDEMYDRLTRLGVRLLLSRLDSYLAGTADLSPQDHGAATFTHFVKKEDGLLSLAEPAETIRRKVRAYAGWPGTWFMYQGKRILVHDVDILDGKLRLCTVQPEGGKRMQFEAWTAGLRKKPAEVCRELGL